MRPIAVVVLVAGIAGCGRSATRPAAAPPPVAQPPIHQPGNGELLASLAPTGATWEDTLALVPPDRARVVAMTFLREGNLGCRAMVAEEVGCGETIEHFAPITPDATLDDPCLRRLVAGWALAQLEATDVDAVADALAAIVALPHPEQELVDAVVALVPPNHDRLRLRLIEAAANGNRADVADALLPGLTPGGAAFALVELGRESALDHLGAAPPPGALAAALDDGLSQPMAHAALEHLAADLDALAEPAVLAAVIRRATSDDCAVAARAAVLLDTAGDGQYLPRHAALTDAATATRALCVSRHISDDESREVLRSVVSADGLDLVDIDHTYMDGPEMPDPDLDGDHDPYTRTTREHVSGADLLGDEILDWLPTACNGAHCEGPTGSIELRFGPGAGHAFSLDEIRIERADHGCGC
jgi:hypothetical protein